MSYTSDEIAIINDTSALKQRVAKLEEENDRLQGQMEWCRNRIEIYECILSKGSDELHT